MIKPHLLYRDRDLDFEQDLPPQESDLVQDLEVDTLLEAMVGGDRSLAKVIRTVLLLGSRDADTIEYRQGVVQDCLRHPEVIREMYDIAVEAAQTRREQALGMYAVSSSPSLVLSSAAKLIRMLIDMFARLKKSVQGEGLNFASQGLGQFCDMLDGELYDEYLSSLRDHLDELDLRGGVLISAELGTGNVGTNYVLRRSQNRGAGWMQRVFNIDESATYRFSINPRHEGSSRALEHLKHLGISSVANALAQSADHMLRFFDLLRQELCLYLGCINLAEALANIGCPITFPEVRALQERSLRCEDLYDVCLALTTQEKPVGNDVDAEDRGLFIITGANQGGKTTFLRSAGLAQLMMQAGMFVPAEYYSADMCSGLFTHFRRKEDEAMESGKLEEELRRMDGIVSNLQEDSMLLLNESFAATNDREGSEIARQLVTALMEKGVKVLFVTHLYGFAHNAYRRQADNTLFLRAERKADGERTFRMIEAEPLRTSYGRDLFRRIFAAD